MLLKHTRSVSVSYPRHIYIYTKFHQNLFRDFGTTGLGEFAYSHYFGYWLLQRFVLLHKSWLWKNVNFCECRIYDISVLDVKRLEQFDVCCSCSQCQCSIIICCHYYSSCPPHVTLSASSSPCIRTVPKTRSVVKSFFQSSVSKCAKELELNISPCLQCIATISCELLLTKTPVSDCCWFSGTDISQDSVAMRLGCGSISNDNFTTNLLLSLQWKNFKNWSTYGKNMSKYITSSYSVDTMQNLQQSVYDTSSNANMIGSSTFSWDESNVTFAACLNTSRIAWNSTEHKTKNCNVHFHTETYDNAMLNTTALPSAVTDMWDKV